MKAVVQRVTQAEVKVGDRVVGKIKLGYVVLLGIHGDDTLKQAEQLAQKILNLRVIADNKGKMNLALTDVKGEVLVISQFTLYADTASRRPGFTEAAGPEKAVKLYHHFITKLKKSGLKVECGEFGAYMKVSLTNDGPVTILLEI